MFKNNPTKGHSSEIIRCGGTLFSVFRCDDLCIAICVIIVLGKNVHWIEATFGQISGNVSFDTQNLQRSFRKNPGFANMLGFTLDVL